MKIFEKNNKLNFDFGVGDAEPPVQIYQENDIAVVKIQNTIIDGKIDEGAEMTAFSVVVNKVEIPCTKGESNTFTGTVPAGTSLTNLPVKFTLSKDAVLKHGTTVVGKKSGKVTFASGEGEQLTVVSEDAKTSSNYTVTITVAPSDEAE